MDSYEIEIKSLLGGKEVADELKRKLKEVDPSLKLISQNSQLNHYFIGGDLEKLYENVSEYIPDTTREQFRKIIKEARDVSVRSRWVNGTALLVLKGSIDDTTSANGISRIEFEEAVSGKSLEELDELILGAEFKYQAKWSREREEYACKGINVSIDKNAGYGYLAEFEKIVDDSGKAEDAQAELRSLMGEVGAVELAQDRLERMFAYYNDNWREFYGTDKIFVIE